MNITKLFFALVLAIHPHVYTGNSNSLSDDLDTSSIQALAQKILDARVTIGPVQPSLRESEFEQIVNAFSSNGKHVTDVRNYLTRYKKSGALHKECFLVYKQTCQDDNLLFKDFLSRLTSPEDKNLYITHVVQHAFQYQEILRYATMLGLTGQKKSRDYKKATQAVIEYIITH